jgi:hypothetical protein
VSNPEHVARMLQHQEQQARTKDLTSVPFSIAAPYIVAELAHGSWSIAGPDGKAVSLTGLAATQYAAESYAQEVASCLNQAWRAGFRAVFDPTIPAQWKRDALKTDGDEPHVHPSNPDIACGCPYGKDE